MTEEKMVSMKDAVDQVKKAATRLGLLHLGFSKILVEEFGEEKAKELITKSMVQFGKLIAKHQKRDNLPFYGIHEKQTYKDQEFLDSRDIRLPEGENFDYSHFKVFGCQIAKAFIDLEEEDLGRLYCYVDPAKSMAENPDRKFIHTNCVLCGDEYCSFEYASTSDKEKEDFKNNAEGWKNVDPILLK